jgi:hypothetical protein
VVFRICGVLFFTQAENFAYAVRPAGACGARPPAFSAADYRSLGAPVNANIPRLHSRIREPANLAVARIVAEIEDFSARRSRHALRRIACQLTTLRQAVVCGWRCGKPCYDLTKH